MNCELLSRIRPDVAGRSAAGLEEARWQACEWDYLRRFPRPRKGAAGAGVRFEKRVVEALEEKHSAFLPSPVFTFSTKYSPKATCIPDGLLFTRDEIIIFEVKLRHTIDAWYQLQQLYAPVVKRVFRRPVRMLEVCRSFNPDEKWPSEFRLVKDLDEFVTRPETPMGVWIWDER